MERQAKLVVGVIFLFAVLANARNLASAQPNAAAGSTIYRLNQQSTYQQGCFPPCLCPVSQAAAVRGTLILTPQSSTGLFKTYAVTDVNWLVSFGDQNLRVTGGGTYEIGGEFAAQQRLQLDLKVSNQPVQHFDSGLVATGAKFPNIVVTISIHGEKCFDTVFTVNTSPVPDSEIHPYRIGLGSSFQRGCFPPCKCAAGSRQPLGGSFDLVDMPPSPLFREFAVADAHWVVVSPAATPPVLIRGTGFYGVGGEVAVEQQLSLDLTVGNEPQTHFDSGLVQGGGNFPNIDVTISIHGMRCIDTVMAIKASPQ